MARHVQSWEQCQLGSPSVVYSASEKVNPKQQQHRATQRGNPSAPPKGVIKVPSKLCLQKRWFQERNSEAAAITNSELNLIFYQKTRPRVDDGSFNTPRAFLHGREQHLETPSSWINESWIDESEVYIFFFEINQRFIWSGRSSGDIRDNSRKNVVEGLEWA